MLSKNELLSWAAVGATVTIVLIVLVHIIGSISVNAGRIDQLLVLDASIRDLVNQIAKDPTAGGIDSLKAGLDNQSKDRDKLRHEIRHEKI